jgi:hypothetical protein
MSRLLFKLAVLVYIMAVALALPSERPSAVTPVILPAPQTSVTSTAFNPALTNAGGTTNSAGTFNVVSLARSSSYAGAGQIQQTTSYVVSDPKFASAQSEVTPSYFTASPSASSSPVNQAASATASSVSLITTRNISVSAVTSVDAAVRISVPINVYSSLGLYLTTMAGVVIAAVAVL